MKQVIAPVRLLSVLFVAIVIASVTGIFPVSPVKAADAITIKTNEATSDFPNGLIFTLEADSNRPIERVELLYRAADSETLNLEIPTFRDGTHIELSHELDFRVSFQPSGIDITYFWRLTDDQGAIVETDEQTLLWYDNRFEWESQTSSDVTVYSYRENQAFAQIILDSAQTTVDRLKEEFSLETVAPIRIWVYNSGADFASAQQGNSSEWIAGTAYPQLHVILAVLPEGNKQEVSRVVPHEISHQMLYQATENPFNAPPTWMDEGFAVRNQDNGNEDDQAMVENAAEKGHLFSVRALNSNFPYDPSDSVLAYAESFSIVNFIIDTYGEEKFAALVAAYRTGVSYDDALRAALGFDLDELDRLWKESLDYPGDQPRSAGSTDSASQWDQFVGPGLASGSLVLFAVLIIAGVFRLSSRRRHHETLELMG